jgi:hypothetical protein
VLIGTTENMSRSDVLVLLNNGDYTFSELPRVGDPLIVEIELPANHIFGKKCMQCQTTVVRISKSETGSPRMALRIHKMRFQNCVKSAAGRERLNAEARQLLM